MAQKSTIGLSLDAAVANSIRIQVAERAVREGRPLSISDAIKEAMKAAGFRFDALQPKGAQ
jgi:hypothetical protein